MKGVWVAGVGQEEKAQAAAAAKAERARAKELEVQGRLLRKRQDSFMREVQCGVACVGLGWAGSGPGM
jgi:hypothetical protein